MAQQKEGEHERVTRSPDTAAGFRIYRLGEGAVRIDSVTRDRKSIPIPRGWLARVAG